MRTRVLGYDGKWALHPDQVTVINEVYTPTQEQFDRAHDILEAYRTATEDDRRGAVMFGDEMIDEASRKMALKFVARGERAGMTRSAKTDQATDHIARVRVPGSPRAYAEVTCDVGSGSPRWCRSSSSPRLRVPCSSVATAPRPRVRRRRVRGRPDPRRRPCPS